MPVTSRRGTPSSWSSARPAIRTPTRPSRRCETAKPRRTSTERGELKDIAMLYEPILTDVADKICTITINRPDKLNALNTAMIRELIDAFDQADADDGVRAIIVTGAGRAFCAGADLSTGGGTFDRKAREERAP